MSMASSPSSWAVDEIEQARVRLLYEVPEGTNYQSNITRTAFAAMVFDIYVGNLLPGVEYVPPAGELRGRAVVDGYSLFDFDDAVGEAPATTMRALGIMLGSNDRFNGSSNITRQEVATILARIADCMDFPFEPWEPTFADSNLLPDWARDGVGSVEWSGIMNGRGNNMFDGTGNLTVEEAVVIMVRLMDYVREEMLTYYEFSDTYEEDLVWESGG